MKSVYDDSFFREAWLVMGAVFIGSVVANLLGAAGIVLGLIWIPAAAYAAMRAPVYIALRVYLVCALFIEPPEMMPGAGYWDSPLEPANEIFYRSLRVLSERFFVGLPLFFSPFLLFAVILAIRATRQAGPATKMPAARLARRTIFIMAFSLLGLEVFGVLRGGNIANSAAQIMPLLTLPVICYAFLIGLRGRQDLYALATIVVSVAVAHAALVFWVYLIVCMPQGIRPEYATTHGDSVTFASAFLILLANVMEVRTKRTLIRFSVVGAGLLIAMVMNNRRLAFASIILGALAMYVALPPSRTRKKANRYMLTVGPPGLLYFFIGEGSTHPLFAPARLAWSAFAQKDHSSNSRVVENENLMATLADVPVLGQGFGWGYKEVVKEYDIEEFMPLYRFLPHNSILWLWSAGGVVGFIGLWCGYVVAVYMAARAYRFAENPVERGSTLAAIGMLACCISIDWGDMGAHNNLRMVIYAVAFAVGARVCADAEWAQRGGGVPAAVR
jgi:O-Antigen ligase